MFVHVDHINKVAELPDATTSMGRDLCFIWNETNTGDLYFTDRTLYEGTYVNCQSLESLHTHFLDIDAEHITGGISTLARDDILVAGTDGNLMAAASSAGYAIWFKVTDFVHLNDVAVRVQIIVGDL